MEAGYRRYPIGIQNFEQLRNNNCVYVDKTELIYRLTHREFVCFLNRPDRFGKSLLISTVEAYFLGKKELFQGLAIERLEKEWVEHPVLCFDFTEKSFPNVDSLKAFIETKLFQWEELYGKEKSIVSISTRLGSIIRCAYEKTGRKAVVLIDGYDSPYLHHKDLDVRMKFRNVLSEIFCPIKGCGKYLQFVLITGVEKLILSMLTGELNNLHNISMRDEYSALCGITEHELLAQLKPDIERMAEANGETYEEACAHLKKQYGGYHFSEKSKEIYSPFCLFNAFKAKEYKSFGTSAGTPTFLLDLLQEADFNIQDLEGVEVSFDTPSYSMMDSVPVLYLHGYLTIKGYDPMFRMYKLGFPNDDVREGIQNWCELR